MNGTQMRLLIYILINVIVFWLYAIDKHRAKAHKYRIPEKTLIYAAVFGVIGAVMGMLLCHHKTRKPKFQIAIPSIMLVESLLVIFSYLKSYGAI